MLIKSRFSLPVPFHYRPRRVPSRSGWTTRRAPESSSTVSMAKRCEPATARGPQQFSILTPTLTLRWTCLRMNGSGSEVGNALRPFHPPRAASGARSMAGGEVVQAFHTAHFTPRGELTPRPEAGSEKGKSQIPLHGFSSFKSFTAAATRRSPQPGSRGHVVGS